MENMWYCTKCKRVFELQKKCCPNCNSEADCRTVEDQDYMMLHEADSKTAKQLVEDFEKNNISFRLETVEESIYTNDDKGGMTTDQHVYIYVLYQDLQKAKECSLRLKEKMQHESETFGEMSPRKRRLVQIISVVLFLLLIAVVVWGTDYITDWMAGWFST